MSNMSYCRFHNTKLDLEDCINALDPYENEYEISNEEMRHGIRMFQDFLDYCKDQDIIESYNFDKIEEIFKEHNKAILELED